MCIYLNTRKVALSVGRCLCKGTIIHVCTSKATCVLLPAALASCGAAVQQSPWPAPAGERGFLALLCNSAAGDPLSCPGRLSGSRGSRLQVLGQRAETLHVLTQTLKLSSRKLRRFIFTSSTSELPTEHPFPHIRC